MKGKKCEPAGRIPANRRKRTADEMRVAHLLAEAKRGNVREVEEELHRRPAIRQRMAEHLGVAAGVKAIMRRLSEGT